MKLPTERIVVTGGDGFLGRCVQAELKRRGVPPGHTGVPLIEHYDLTREADVVRMYETLRPTVVMHLAAEVGGIGANRANPGSSLAEWHVSIKAISLSTA